ncbi:unnamed protein product [marine sediment metagenome]|uniref:Uncharacterized protein n=1 Tax=marine sediment metagenome TaxID=412755 RepID=X0VLV5_9ZZZZ
MKIDDKIINSYKFNCLKPCAMKVYFQFIIKNEKQFIFSMDELGANTFMSISSILAGIKDLNENKFIKIIGKGGKNKWYNIYELSNEWENE